MKVADLTTGQSLPITAGIQAKGFRVIPVLASPASPADIEAAYANCEVLVTRLSTAVYQSGNGSGPAGVTDTYRIAGPDWVRSPGFGALILSGQIGVTYRVWWAEDCYEIIDPVEPFYPGLTPSSTGMVVNAASYTAAQSSTANIPSAGSDGVQIPGTSDRLYYEWRSSTLSAAGSATVSLRATQQAALAIVSAGSGQTVTAGGTGVWWRYTAALGRWAETQLQDLGMPGGRRDVMGTSIQTGV